MAKVKVSIAVGSTNLSWDFGNFKSDKTIEVDQGWWQIYIKKRLDFEMMHDDLIKSACKKYNLPTQSTKLAVREIFRQLASFQVNKITLDGVEYQRKDYE